MTDIAVSNEEDFADAACLPSRLVDTWYGRGGEGAIEEYFDELPDEESMTVLNAAADQIRGPERYDFIESIFDAAQSEKFFFQSVEEGKEPETFYGYADLFVIPCVVRGDEKAIVDDMEFTSTVEEALIDTGWFSENSSVMLLPYFIDPRDAARLSPHDVHNILRSLAKYNFVADDDGASLTAFEILESVIGKAPLSGVSTNIHGNARLLIGVRAVPTINDEVPDDIAARFHRPHEFGNCPKTERAAQRAGGMFCQIMVEAMKELSFPVSFDTPKTWNIGLGMSGVTDLYARFVDEAVLRNIDLYDFEGDLHIAEVPDTGDFYLSIANPHACLGPVPIPDVLLEFGVTSLKVIFEEMLGLERIFHSSLETFPRLKKSHCN